MDDQKDIYKLFATSPQTKLHRLQYAVANRLIAFSMQIATSSPPFVFTRSCTNTARNLPTTSGSQTVRPQVKLQHPYINRYKPSSFINYSNLIATSFQSVDPP
ncbi:unnamed protein product [Caenorhabditis angaria]|uniref:Uncharacterized protein n=1 Tax=Caenorhabditis angaria TaxID=860376 RepID=A0A9P1IHH0_9PELO|nr:unnamed protein product [Caenorhabditis angaria]